MATLEQKKESLSDFLANNSQDAQAPQVPADPTIPQVQAQSPNPQQALSTVQPPQTNQVPSGLQGMFGKDAPESMESSMLRGMFQQSPTIQPQIQPFQDNVSPARSLLTNFVNGLTAGTMGQRFFTTRAQRYKEWYDLQNLRLQQQQREILEANNIRNNQAKILNQQQLTSFRQDKLAVEKIRDANKQNAAYAQMSLKYGMDAKKLAQAEAFHKDALGLTEARTNLANAQADEIGQVKDPDYKEASQIVDQYYRTQGKDPDNDLSPQELLQRYQTTQALAASYKQQRMQWEAKYRAEGQRPPQALMVGPDGKAYQVTPGTQVIPGSQTPQGVNTMNTPTMATRRAGEQGQIIQNMGDYLISQIENNRDIFGNLPSYWKKAMNNSPVSDPRAARLISEIQSFAALQPALHGFRSSQAMEEFEKSIGGISKNPDALIQAIKGIQQTGGIVHLVGEGKGNTSTAPKVGTVEGGYRFKGGDPGNPLSWEKVK